MASRAKTMSGSRPKIPTAEDLDRLAEKYLDQNVLRMTDAERYAKTAAWDLHTMEGKVPEGFRKSIKNSTRSAAKDRHLKYWKKELAQAKNGQRDERVRQRFQCPEAAAAGNGNSGGGGGNSGAGDSAVPHDSKRVKTTTERGTGDGSNGAGSNKVLPSTFETRGSGSGGDVDASDGGGKAGPAESQDGGGGGDDSRGSKTVVARQSDEDTVTEGGDSDGDGGSNGGIKATQSEGGGDEAEPKESANGGKSDSNCGGGGGSSLNIDIPAPPAMGDVFNMGSGDGWGGGGGGVSENDMYGPGSPVRGELYALGDFAELLWDVDKDEWHRVQITHLEKKRSGETFAELTFVRDTKKRGVASGTGWVTEVVNMGELIMDGHLTLPMMNLQWAKWPDLYD